ncbi:MAG: hypothetical protein EXR85_09075 [Xanthomonadales bacterium]|nr:hypothetical protein [Xanthomonadales bacterium]
MKTQAITWAKRLSRSLGTMALCLGSVAPTSAANPPVGSGTLPMPSYSFHTSHIETTPSGVTVRTGAEYVYTSIPEKIDVDLARQPKAAQWQAGDPSWEVPMRRGPPAIVDPRPVNKVASPIDPVWQQPDGAQLRAATSFATPAYSFASLRSSTSPNDPNGEVGKDWFVIAINASGGTQYEFYDKSDPTITSGPYTLGTLGLGVCAGSGDPVVLYDELAERWLFTEFSLGSNRLCVYVSQTDDPISGGFYAYTFQAPSFPDYPKYAVWGDAYYVGTNESAGSAVWALDRSAMLNGQPATMQRFDELNIPGAFSFAMIPPVDLDGHAEPPPGSPGIFIRHYDDEAHLPIGIPNVPTEDYLELFEFHVDFADETKSRLTGPIRIAVSEFSSELCGYTSYFCFPQKGSTSTLDPLREVVMNLPKYRNFGDHESIVGNFTVDVDGADRGGIRWFELRRAGGSWSLYQEGTWSPDSNNRFMGASAMDASGNIALGYSISSSSLYPGVRYTGRLESSPLGGMSEAEVTLVDGTGPSPGNRWGDYGSLSVDPEDGCTFWLVENYAKAGSSARQNRVGSFKFDSCGQALDLQFKNGFEPP